MDRKIHIPPHYVVEDATAQRKPPEVRIWTLRNQSRVGDCASFHFHATLTRMLGPWPAGREASKNLGDSSSSCMGAATV